ncbi:hypothetical protein JCM10450v2_000457 [Rhodotorula kratochvilovae]
MATQLGTPPCAIPSAGPPPSSMSYSASLPPTYRLSAFPVSPSDCSALPPGLGLAQRGCASDDERSDDEQQRAPPASGRAQAAPRTIRGFDPAPRPLDDAALTNENTGSSSAASSRKGSAGSLASTTETDDSGGSETPLSSLAGSLLSDVDAGKDSPATAAGAGSNLARTSPALGSLEWGVRGLSIRAPLDDAAKREREARAVRGGWEDPALAAARRALWDDVPAEEVGGENAPAGEPVVEVILGGEADPSGDEGASDAAVEDDDSDDEWGLPPVRLPCHTTLAPRSSCLRYSPAARTSISLPSLSTSSSSPADDPSASGRHSPSADSTASTSAPSVSFSCAPPQTCATWSAEAYSRRGDAPVEKLSIREWIELQGVREAVGVWSGKIAKWDEVLAADAAAPPAAAADVCAARGRPPCQLAAVVGVVHVSRSTPSSPVDTSRSLP